MGHTNTSIIPVRGSIGKRFDTPIEGLLEAHALRKYKMGSHKHSSHVKKGFVHKKCVWS